MTGRTNYTGPTNGSSFDVPGDIADVYAHFDGLLDKSVANPAALPGSGNWNGRQVFVESNKLLYQHDGTGWVVVGGDIPIGLARRTTTALTAPSGSYGDMSATAAWSTALSGGVTYSNGFTVPIAGMYQVEWSLLISIGGSGIGGIAVSPAVPNGAVLHAPGIIASAGAAFGNGSAMVRLSAGDLVKFYAYGNGSTLTITATADHPASHWGVRWVAP